MGAPWATQLYGYSEDEALKTQSDFLDVVLVGL